MIHLSICIERPQQKYELLAHIIMINTYHPEYTYTISCDKTTEDYIRNFPYKFSGLLEFVCDMSEYENASVFFKRKFNNMKRCITRWGSALETPPYIFTMRKLDFLDDVDEICFAETGMHVHESRPQDRYNLNVLYISSLHCIEFINKLFCEAERQAESEYQDIDQDNSKEPDTNGRRNFINNKIKNVWSNLSLSLIEEFSIEKFFPYNSCMLSAQFMALKDSLVLKNLTRNFMYVVCENDNRVSDKDTDGSDESETVNKVIREDPIYMVYISMTASMDIIRKIQETMVSRMLEYNFKYMTLLQLRSETISMELSVPYKFGMYRWNRNNCPPGLYDVFELIVQEYGAYVKIKTDKMREYFSVNNFLLFDKPDDTWLTNMSGTYTEILMCNYSQDLLKILEQHGQSHSFLCYHSDEPRKLEENRAAYKEHKKIYDVVEVEDGSIKAFKYLAKTNKLKEKATFETKDLSWEEKYDILSKSKFVMMHGIDVNLIANCLGMQVVVIADNDTTLLDIEKDKHYIYFDDLAESFPKWKDMAAECDEYYVKSVSPKGVFTNLLTHVFPKDY